MMTKKTLRSEETETGKRDDAASGSFDHHRRGRAGFACLSRHALFGMSDCRVRGVGVCRNRFFAHPLQMSHPRVVCHIVICCSIFANNNLARPAYACSFFWPINVTFLFFSQLFPSTENVTKMQRPMAGGHNGLSDSRIKSFLLFSCVLPLRPLSRPFGCSLCTYLPIFTRFELFLPLLARSSSSCLL
jgi:hypothetical protein